MTLRPLLRAALAAALALLPALTGTAQIVNRLRVDHDSFERYAYGRMQMYNPDNLPLADSLYRVGEARLDYRFKCLALSLEMPVRFAQGDTARMDAVMAEIKSTLEDHKEYRAFLYSAVHEYCQFLIHDGRVSEAMLEARELMRDATEAQNALGKMYSHRIVGLIQSYRTNPHLAVENFTKAAEFCKEARAEQELPNLYILIAQEYIRQGEFGKAVEFCNGAEYYQDYFPTLRIKVLMTRCFLYYAENEWDRLWENYDKLVADPLYKVQAEADDRYEMDVCYLRSRRLFREALTVADSLSTDKARHTLKHGIYADLNAFPDAYGELSRLMDVKDSIYIKVQNEDMAILDAEMNNAQLRADAERLRHQNENTILLGFLVMFAIAFFSILVSQWQLRENLETLRKQNGHSLLARQAYQKALDAKEAENDMKIKILQNRKSNTIKL
ncbi:MAG: hypothetical protein IJU27_06460 [Bacteroidales bacterium]|nr:hypothetical protein [Bacteroidales bacterium]